MCTVYIQDLTNHLEIFNCKLSVTHYAHSEPFFKRKGGKPNDALKR